MKEEWRKRMCKKLFFRKMKPTSHKNPFVQEIDSIINEVSSQITDEGPGDMDNKRYLPISKVRGKTCCNMLRHVNPRDTAPAALTLLSFFFLNKRTLVLF